MRRSLFLSTLGLVLVVLGCEYDPSNATPGPLRSCDGQVGTIGVGYSVATDPAGGSTYFGTQGDDVIIVVNGPVRVNAMGGNDVICVADSGLADGPGKIEIFGGNGDDTVTVAGSKPVIVWGGPGADTVTGGSGYDVCLDAESTTGCEETVELELLNYEITPADSSGNATITFDTTLCANPDYAVQHLPDVYNWPTATATIVHEPAGCWQDHELQVGNWTAALQNCAQYNIEITVSTVGQSMVYTNGLPSGGGSRYGTWCDLTLDMNVVGQLLSYEPGYLVNPVAHGPASTDEYCLVFLYSYQDSSPSDPCSYTTTGGSVGAFARIGTITGYNSGVKCFWVVAIEDGVRVQQSSPNCNDDPETAGPLTITNVHVTSAADGPNQTKLVTIAWDYPATDSPAEWHLANDVAPGADRTITVSIPASANGSWNYFTEITGVDPSTPDAQPQRLFSASG